MALDIIIFDDWKITSDAHNVITHRKTIVDPTKHPKWEERKAKGESPELRESWPAFTYHSTVEQALVRIGEQKLRESDAKTVEELLHEIRMIKLEISDVLSVQV